MATLVFRSPSGRGGWVGGSDGVGSPMKIRGVDRKGALVTYQADPATGLPTLPNTNGSFNSEGQATMWRNRVLWPFTISGIARDLNGNPIPNAVIKLYRTSDDSVVKLFNSNDDYVLSDANGLFTFTLGNNAGNFYIVAYLQGAPDVAGTTVNTLTAT
jgi:hypothetical protein